MAARGRHLEVTVEFQNRQHKLATLAENKDCQTFVSLIRLQSYLLIHSFLYRVGQNDFTQLSLDIGQQPIRQQC